MIQFSKPYINKLIIDEVTDTLKSGWITTGPKTKLFEKKITEYCGNKETICVSSATAGLELVLRWFGVGPGDEVIVPAYTYCATANAVMHCGAIPIMCDVDNDFNISTSDLIKKISWKTKVIIPVDIAGLPCNYIKIRNIVNTFKKLFIPTTSTQSLLGRILILSDAAHSFGASLYNKKAGSLTDITVFSFHAVKNLTTAEGGAICLNLDYPFNNKEIYKQLSISSLHGQSKSAYEKQLNNNWKYDVTEAGYKCNMTDIHASIGLVQLSQYNAILLKRSEIFKAYQYNFMEFSWSRFYSVFIHNEIEPSYHLFLLRVNGIIEETRDLIIQDIFSKGISVNVHFKPLPLLTFYKKLGYKIEDYPNAYSLYSNVISLPIYYDLSEKDIKIIIKGVTESIEKYVNKR